MTRSSKMFALLAMTTALGCSAETTGSPDGDEATTSTSSPLLLDDIRITVMTQNVYLGMAVEPVLAAPTEADVPIAVAAAWRTLHANRFDERADAIAASIAKRRPDVIGLQEVALYRHFPGNGDAPSEIDFLAVLQKALKKRGLAYKTAAVQNDTDVLVPMLAGLDASGAPILDGVEVIDRDVVLVRADVGTSKPRAGRYQASVPVPAFGTTVEIVRGWVSVDVQAFGGSYRFLSTHLEDLVPEVQAAQATELLELVNGEKMPVVVAGDFNSPADGSGTPTYATLRAAGLRDAWSAAHPNAPGFTCCRAEDLHVATPLTERVDIVFARGRSSKPIPGIVTATLEGEAWGDRTRSGLWPSDHAGVVASFRSPTLW